MDKQLTNIGNFSPQKSAIFCGKKYCKRPPYHYLLILLFNKHSSEDYVCFVCEDQDNYQCNDWIKHLSIYYKTERRSMCLNNVKDQPCCNATRYYAHFMIMRIFRKNVFFFKYLKCNLTGHQIDNVEVRTGDLIYLSVGRFQTDRPCSFENYLLQKSVKHNKLEELVRWAFPLHSFHCHLWCPLSSLWWIKFVDGRICTCEKIK